jgi:PPOX class probable F420-dependent enzyme
VNVKRQIDELGDLYELPLVAVLASRWEDGRLLLSPVWHEFRDGAFYVSSYWTDVKVRHLRRDPHTVFLLFESNPPYRGIEVTTTAEITRVDDREVLTRIASRYLGEQDGREYAEAAPDNVVIRIAPGAVRAWDFAEQFD